MKALVEPRAAVDDSPMQLYPLRFQPILKRYLWGGRRLGTHLGKSIGPESDYAESWEICDRPQDQSVVADGPLAGKTLGELVQTAGPELLGRHHPQPRFPLLFKFLDAQKTLSVQVHPDDAMGALLTPPDLGKTEAWVILAADPEALVYAGLKRGFDRAAVERELTRGTVELCLHRWHPQPGEVVFVPAGLVHALGAGLLIAEIQQSSDTTFRLHDWNRLGPDGKPRPLHIAQSLEAIDFDLPPPQPQSAQSTDRPNVERLVDCDKFVLDRITIGSKQATADPTTEAVEPSPVTIGGDDRCHILAVLEGSVRVEGDPSGQPLSRGSSMLIPAACGPVRISPADMPADHSSFCILLDAYLP